MEGENRWSARGRKEHSSGETKGEVSEIARLGAKLAPYSCDFCLPLGKSRIWEVPENQNYLSNGKYRSLMEENH